MEPGATPQNCRVLSKPHPPKKKGVEEAEEAHRVLGMEAMSGGPRASGLVQGPSKCLKETRRHF